MGVIDLTTMPVGAKVMMDTAPIIYLLEGHQTLLDPFRPLFEKIDSGEYCAVISAVTLAEVLAGPIKHGNEILADRYYQLLTASPNWQFQEMNAALSLMAARIRVRYQLKLPDAIQVASAIYSQSAALITHDQGFSKVDEIKVLGL